MVLHVIRCFVKVRLRIHCRNVPEPNHRQEQHGYDVLKNRIDLPDRLDLIPFVRNEVRPPYGNGQFI